MEKITSEDLIENLHEVVKIILGYDYNYEKAKSEIEKRLDGELNINTLRTNGSLLVKIAKRWMSNNVTQECVALREEIVTLQESNSKLALELHATQQMSNSVTQECVAPPNYKGWTVARYKGLIRLHRRVAGTMKSIYIGKRWDEDKVRERLNSYS